MVSFSSDPAVTEALRQWRSRSVLPTDLGSVDLAGLARQLRQRSVFSARTTHADYLAEVQDVVDRMLSGEIALSEGRFRLMKKLKELNYDPEVGFPQDMGKVPRAERDTLQDLSSESRIDLMLETNMRQAASYGQRVEGNGEYARYAYPAWELVRLYTRTLPRGERRGRDGEIVADPGNAWPARWHAAGESVNWEGAVKSPMAALKDSPIWQALGDGAGDYTDTLGQSYPPFAFRSGMAWRAVARDAAKGMGLLNGAAAPAAVPAQLSPGNREIAAAFQKLPEDLQARLRKRLLAA